MQSIYGLSHEEIRELCVEAGGKPFRAKQVWQWLYKGAVRDWEAMRTLPAAFRTALAQRVSLDPGHIEHHARAANGTIKLLIALADGEHVEAVLIPAANRLTLCLSSQVGCRFRCAFCASGQSGFHRSLATAEIIGQFMLAWQMTGEKPTHVVFMGVGEPFDNYDAVLNAVRILNDAVGIRIAARRITISTCGLVSGINRLAEEPLQVELSVSLHAPNEALRTDLMPVNRLHPLADLIPACRHYSTRTGRIITFEYTLIHGRNDRPEHARQLADLLKPLACRVNAIPLSPVDEFAGAGSCPSAVHAFMHTLNTRGINATLRASRGKDITAACGQLRARTHSASGT